MPPSNPNHYEGTPITDEYCDVWEQYCGYVAGEYEKKTTRRQWERGSKRWFNWCASNGVDATTADTGDVEDYVQDINHLSDNSRITSFMSVLVLYEWWLSGNSGLDLDENPTADIDISDYANRGSSKYATVLSRQGKSTLKAPSKGMITALFEYADEDGSDTALRNETLLRLMWDTAARADEISRMRTDKIDWDDNSIKIVSSKLKPHQELYERYVYFSDTTRRFLDLWCNGGREALSTTYSDSEYLFHTTHNPQMRPGHISRIVKEAAHRHDNSPDTDEDIQLLMYRDAADKPRWLLTGHRVRHARISHLCNHTDMSINNIRMMAGHQKIQTTLDYVTTDWDTVRDDYQQAISD